MGPKVSWLCMGLRGIEDGLPIHRYGRGLCFMCGVPLTASNQSSEHVFPRWLQNRYELWDRKLMLFNRTTIKYSELKIASCRDCNGSVLAPIESAVAEAVAKGYEAFAALDEITLFHWITKIHYGINFKSSQLSANRSQQEGTAILSDDQIRYFRHLHLFLQSARFPLYFENFTPWSIFCFAVDPSDHPAKNFLYRDHLPSNVVSLRMGEVGVVACLLDNGVLHEKWSATMAAIAGAGVKDFQFLEISARLAYESTLIADERRYTIVAHRDGLEAHVLRDPTTVSFLKWNNREYAEYLAEYWERDIEWLSGPKGIRSSLLELLPFRSTEDGK
jgi:hypothetical protein